MQFAASTDARSGRQRLDFLRRHAGVGGVEVHRMDQVRGGPFDESVYIGGDRNRWRILYVLEDGVEHRSRELGEMGHQRTELAVEGAENKKGFFAENREPRVMNPADGILRPKQPRHQWWKLFSQRLRVRRRFQGKAEGKVVLAHDETPLLLTGSCRNRTSCSEPGRRSC